MVMVSHIKFPEPVSNIIIADDDDIVIELLKDELFKNNAAYHLLAVAHDGAELVESCRAHRPDLVITDIDMPVMNGLTAIKKIREMNKQVKLIALSSYNNYSYYKHLLEVGANGYVMKDLQFTFYELKKAIQGLKHDAFYLDSRVRTPKEPAPPTNTVDPINDLNFYERKITRLTYAGKTIKEISEETGKSPKTVEKYRSDIYVKLGVKNAIELVKYIAMHNLVI